MTVKLPSWPFPVGIYLDKTISTPSDPVEKWPDSDKSEIKYLHIRNHVGHSYTLAYRNSVKGKKVNFIEVAVAVCSPKDQYSRKLGRILAESRLNAGNYIMLPVSNVYASPAEMLYSIFHGLA